MKKLALVAICVLGIAFAGSAVNKDDKTKKEPAKTEVTKPATKPAAKPAAKPATKPAEKPAEKPAAPAKK